MPFMWYVARTEPRTEFIAAVELGLDGYDVFFPCITNTQNGSGNNEVPLFPGYLFLRLDPDAKGWPSFSARHRVVGMVKNGTDVPALADSCIETIKDLLGTINIQGGATRTFSPGETVQVSSGVLQGLGGVIADGKSSHARAKVLLQFMGRMLEVQVPWKNLFPIEGHRVDEKQRSRRTRGKGRWVNGFKPVANGSR